MKSPKFMKFQPCGDKCEVEVKQAAHGLLYLGHL